MIHEFMKNSRKNMQNSNSCRCTFWLMLYCYEVGRSKKEETGKKEGKPGILAMFGTSALLLQVMMVWAWLTQLRAAHRHSLVAWSGLGWAAYLKKALIMPNFKRKYILLLEIK